MTADPHPALVGLLPYGVAVEWSDRTSPPAQLRPDETRWVASAVAERQREFAEGRHCARQALARFGLSDASIPVGSGRQPVWPPGFVGSITHTRDICCAAVAQTVRYRALGIDAEPADPLPAELVHVVCSDAELSARARVLARDQPLVDRVVFCAKEAVFKMQYPLTEAFLEFDQVAIELGDGVFAARLEVDAGCFSAKTILRGRWRCGCGIVTAAAWLSVE